MFDEMGIYFKQSNLFNVFILFHVSVLGDEKGLFHVILIRNFDDLFHQKQYLNPN